MQFSTDYHNSADKVNAIEYAKEPINQFQLILRCISKKPESWQVTKKFEFK